MREKQGKLQKQGKRNRQKKKIKRQSEEKQEETKTKRHEKVKRKGQRDKRKTKTQGGIPQAAQNRLSDSVNGGLTFASVAETQTLAVIHSFCHGSDEMTRSLITLKSSRAEGLCNVSDIL